VTVIPFGGVGGIGEIENSFAFNAYTGSLNLYQSGEKFVNLVHVPPFFVIVTM
jgi:hypothetical protein